MIQHVTGVIGPVAQRLWKLWNCHIWPVDLVAWFSLRVREVSGSTTGQVPCLPYCQKILQAVTAKIFFVFFTTIFLDAKNWTIKQEKKSKDKKRKRCFILLRKRRRASNCEISLKTIKSLLWTCSNKYQLSWKCLILMSKETFHAQRKLKEKHKFVLLWFASSPYQSRKAEF